MKLSNQFPTEEGFYWLLWYRPVEYGHHEFKAPDEPVFEIVLVTKKFGGGLMLLLCGSMFEHQDSIYRFGEAKFSERIEHDGVE